MFRFIQTKQTNQSRTFSPRVNRTRSNSTRSNSTHKQLQHRRIPLHRTSIISGLFPPIRSPLRLLLTSRTSLLQIPRSRLINFHNRPLRLRNPASFTPRLFNLHNRTLHRQFHSPTRIRSNHHTFISRSPVRTIADVITRTCEKTQYGIKSEIPVLTIRVPALQHEEIRFAIEFRIVDSEWMGLQIRVGYVDPKRRRNESDL